MSKLKTHQQARAWFDHAGISIAEWAREHGFGRSMVYEVLSGKRACKRGASHRIAVLLGIKHGALDERPDRSPMRAAPPNSQPRRAA